MPGIFDKFTPSVAREVQDLHSFLCELNIYVVTSNQGYSVKIIDIARGRCLSLDAAVSLYNKGVDSYAAKSLKAWQRKRLAVISRRLYHPITLQRWKGILITSKTLNTCEAFDVVSLVKSRREYLGS